MCFRVTRCCCCGSLETGTKVIAILGIIVGVISLVSNVAKLQTESIIGGIVELLLYSMLLYGASEKKPAFLMAWLVVDMIWIVLLYITAAVLALLTFFVDSNWEEIRKSFGGEFDDNDANEKEYVKMALWIAAVMVFFGTVLHHYFWVVVRSFHLDVQSGMYNTPTSYGLVENRGDGGRSDVEKGYQSKM